MGPVERPGRAQVTLHPGGTGRSVAVCCFPSPLSLEAAARAPMLGVPGRRRKLPPRSPARSLLWSRPRMCRMSPPGRVGGARRSGGTGVMAPGCVARAGLACTAAGPWHNCRTAEAAAGGPLPIWPLFHGRPWISTASAPPQNVAQGRLLCRSQGASYMLASRLWAMHSSYALKLYLRCRQPFPLWSQPARAPFPLRGQLAPAPVPFSWPERPFL